MSNFDSNPFANTDSANPFADPSIRQAASNTPGGLDDFNPFADTNKTQPAPGGTQTTKPAMPAPQPSQPAIMTPSEDPAAPPPPPYAATGAQKVDTSDLQRRQEELERKAAELQRKEQEMRDLHLTNRQNNWPPLPKWFPVGPCFYQDFSVDIPLEFQRTVKFIYYQWMFYVFILFLNILGSLASFIVNKNGVTFALSILWFFLFSPCSFICWYRPVYKAFRSDSSFNFFVFFFIFFLQFCTCVVMCLGITDFTVGWINALEIIGKSPGAGGFMLSIAIGFTVCAILQIILLMKVHRIYRSTGASFQKAQQEFSQGVLKNENVQNAASNAAAGAVHGAAQQYGSSSRY